MPPPRPEAPLGSKVRECVPIFLTAEWNDRCLGEQMFEEATRLGYFVYNHDIWRFPDAEIEPYEGLTLRLGSEAMDDGTVRLRLDGTADFGDEGIDIGHHGVVVLPAGTTPTRALLRDLFVVLVESRAVVDRAARWKRCHSDRGRFRAPDAPDVRAECRDWTWRPGTRRGKRR